jgi:hypothetical protein
VQEEQPSKRARKGRAAPTVAIRILPKEHDVDDEDSSDVEDDDIDWDILGHQGAYECTRNFSAMVEVDGQRAGTLTATLVDRDCGDMFHTACDAESSELQAMSCFFFGRRGQARYPALKSDRSVGRQGGFLYIGTFSVDAAHRSGGSTDVGCAAIRALLSCEELAGRWTVAAYIADREACMTPAQKQKEHAAAMEHFHRYGDFSDEVEDPAKEAARIAKDRAARARDARQFLRAGFKECAEGWLYMTLGMLQSTAAMTHSAALAVPMLLAAPASASEPQTLADAKLLKRLKRLVSDYTSSEDGKSAAIVLERVDEGLQEGANLTRAAVLHFCVANGYVELIQPLIARGAEVDAFDANSMTPLMIAARRALRNWNAIHNRQQDTTMVAALIALGANKNVVDPDGRSALGHYYADLRSTNDFHATFSLAGGMTPVDPTLRAMLTPTDGPTSADQNHDDDDDDDDDEDEDDDDDDVDD